MPTEHELIGKPAPLFELPTADGQVVALADQLPKGPAIVYFTRGLTCPFCRRHRAQLTLGCSTFRELGAEVFEITPTTVERASIYYAKYALAFPYLCDPSGQTAERYGVQRGDMSLVPALRAVLADALGGREVWNERKKNFFELPTKEELAHGGMDGFFIVGQNGIIHYARTGLWVGVPPNQEVVTQLREITRGVSASK